MVNTAQYLPTRFFDFETINHIVDFNNRQRMFRFFKAYKYN